MGSSYARDDFKHHFKKLIPSCSSIFTSSVNIPINNYNNKDNCLYSDLCICNQVLLNFYQNRRGLRTKLRVLKCNVAVFDYLFICFTEIWLCDSFHDYELGLTNYIVYRCNRNSLTSSFSRGGGVLIAVRSDIISNLICFPVTNAEQLFAKLSCINTDYIVCSVYFPPNCPISTYESFISAVQSVLLLYPECILIFYGTSI